MKPLRKIQLYQFKDFDMDKFVSLYLYEINPHEELDADTLSTYTPAKMKMTEAKAGAKRRDIIENKCRYLQDAIIRMAYSANDDGTITLNAHILQNVIGKDYKPMLQILVEMGHIELGDGQGGADHLRYYEIGKYSTLYTVKNTDTIYTQPFINKAISDYKDKTKVEVGLLKEKVKTIITNKYGQTFYDKYLTSLNYIKIEDLQGLYDAIAQKVKEKPSTENYYHYVVNELKSKKIIYKIDQSGRMYHVLTNLDRDLKKFLNIDFMLDCKNSHPLLFNYFIFNKLHVELNLAYNISSYLHILANSSVSPSLSILHNDSEYLYNYLINNNIQKEDIANVSNDVLEYVYLTSNGLLWDELCSNHPDMDRQAIKQAMFGSVFYSNSPVPDIWNEYAAEFKQRFPTVYDIIMEWKQDNMQKQVILYMKAHNLPTNKGTASLSIAMMALEAEIFTAILKRIYAKRWNAIHLHDCIVIPKDGNKNHPTIDDIRSIMLDVYKGYGLYPTFG